MFEEFHRRKQAANLSTHTLEPSRHFNSICYDDHDDDDDEEKTIPLCDIISQLPLSIIVTTSPHVLPIMEPEDSLIIGNEDLNTIPKKESDELINSSVEDLVLVLSKFEDTSKSDSECDLPACDDFSPINVPEGKFVTFSNPLFDSNDDFTSCDDESLFDEDVPKDNVLEDIESKASYDSKLDKPAVLVTPLSDANEDECSDPGGGVDEINAFDIPSDFEDGYYDSDGDVLYLESLLSDDATPNLPPEVLLGHDPRSLKIPSGESKEHIEVLSMLWGNRLPIRTVRSRCLGDEELSTILEKESDDVIKSSVDDLVPIPSESEDTFGSNNEYDLPSCDDFSPIDVPEGKSVTFFNPLFDSNDDFTSSDDESLSDEDVPENSDIKSKASYDSNLDEPALLVTPLFYSNKDECFDPGGDVDEINALDILLYFKNGYYDSKGDVLYLESLLGDDTTPNLPPEVFLDRDSRSLSDINDLEIMVKVFDPRILEKIFSTTYGSLPFKDRHYHFFTYVIRSFLPYFTCPVDYPFLFSSGSEDTIFDPDISAFHFSSLEPVASHRSETFICFNVYPNILNESSMKICSST
nr:hypothetical protein [Tanacetum cinerariifolium]GEY16315.1 hypothetical protein [Tanacetum cinerariifolium]